MKETFEHLLDLSVQRFDDEVYKLRKIMLDPGFCNELNPEFKKAAENLHYAIKANLNLKASYHEVMRG